MQTLNPLTSVLPGLEFVLEIRADLAPTMDLGRGPLGGRRMVPIVGGHFEGPRLRGRVLPGGADRQLVRDDGVRQLAALYELETDDGAVLTVDNRVLVDEPRDGARYAFSHVSVTAPAGPHDWLNRVVLVGQLHRLRPQPAVLVSIYALRHGWAQGATPPGQVTGSQPALRCAGA